MGLLKVGDSFEEIISFSQEEVIAFAEVTGDKNPIHLDAAYSSTTIFRKPIIHGFLSGSVFSKIIGTKFPGKGTIYLQQDMSFRAPMFVEEEYRVVIEVTAIKREKHQAILKTVIYNELGKETIIGLAKILNNIKI